MWAAVAAAFCPGHAIALWLPRVGGTYGRAPRVLLRPAGGLGPWGGESSFAGAGSTTLLRVLKFP